MRKKKKSGLTPRADGRYCTKYNGKSFYGKTPEEAISKRDAYKERLERGLDPDRERVIDYARDWVPIHKPGVRPKTMQLFKYFLKIIAAEFEEKPIKEVKPSDIKRIYSTRFKNASESHIRHFRNLLTAIFDSATEEGYCQMNPCRSRYAAPHKGTAGSHRSISVEERSLIENTPAKLRPLAMTMLYAGLRDSEAMALDVGRDVDFQAKVIHVRYFRHLDGNKAFVDQTGKTPKAIRDVPLFPPLEDALKDIKGLLIADSHGKILSQAGWHSAWSSYIVSLEEALNGGRHKRWYGLTNEDKANPPPPWREVKLQPYDLRHSFCTWCRDNGVEMHVLQVWMGHSDSAMISRIYDHVTEDRIQSEAAKIVQKYEKK